MNGKKNHQTNQKKAQHSNSNEVMLLPQDTKNALGKNPFSMVKNFYLIYHKLIYLLITEKNGSGKINKDFSKILPSLNDIYKKQFFDLINNRNVESAKSLFGENYKSFTMTNQWRLAIGLGNESVYETSLSLHYIYGIPYIPGQSLKGAIRSYVIQNYFGGSEAEAISRSVTFCKLFGTPEFIENQNGKRTNSILGKAFQGDIVFYDALPTDNFLLIEDIMNPHYSEYYSEKKPPADIYEPVPIKFLVLKETEFQFILGLLSRVNYEVEWENGKIGILDLAEKLTKEALEKGGVGGKTSVGYGYFQ